MNKIVFTSLICLPLFFCFYPAQKQSPFPITPNSQSSIPIENQENTDSCIALAALKITAPENENVLLSPFACPVAFFQTYNDAGGSGNFSTYDLACGGTPVFDAISTLGFNINATDYNPIDNFIYTIRKSDSHLLRLHSDGNFDDVGALALTTNPVIGGFDPSGLLYIKAGNASPIEIVNVNTLAVTLVDPGVNFDGKDWSYHYQKGKFYGVHGGGGGDFLYSYDPATNTVESFPITGLQGGDGPTYGATFYSSDGFIYAANNSTGNIYRLDVDANEAHFILQGANGNGGNDGGSCPFALPQIPIVYAFPDTICALTGAPNTFNIHDNDETHLLPSLDFSTFSILNPPSFGTTSYSNGNLTYTPSGNAQTDILTYQICGTDDCGQLICDYTDVVILAGEDPTFTIENMYCEGEPTAPLPSISDNGISGTWTPNIISNTTSGNYIFTPDASECANSFTLNVTIQTATNPTFSIQNTYCEGETTAALPTISDNGISGTWTPNTISNTTSGNYIFTPNVGECANSFNLNITIQTATAPTFSIQNTYCEGETAAVLPTISDNGISGTWTPNNISNTTSGNYIFTPDALECANSFTLNVTIQTATNPTFSIQNTYCEGETTAALSTISTNGISGTWTPNNISNTTSGNYIFTPDASECANSFTLNVTIQTATNPTFSIQTNYCEE